MTPKATPDHSKIALCSHQVAEVFDTLLFTIRNASRCNLPRLRNWSKIDSNCYLSGYCLATPQTMQFQIKNVPTWLQHGTNLGPTNLCLGALLELQIYAGAKMPPTWPSKASGPPKISSRTIQNGRKNHQKSETLQHKVLYMT